MKTTKTKQLWICICLLLLVISVNAQPIPYAGGRILVSSDGNEHDKDDWAATPFTLALLASQGLQDQVTVYTFSDHIWGSNFEHSDALEQMRESALQGGIRFDFNNTNFIEAVTNTNAAYNAVRDEINASSASNKLYIIAAGPMQVVGEGISRADPSKLQHVRLISHSNWNNRHSDNPSSWENHSGWTLAEIQNQFQSQGLTVDQINNQNGGPGYDGMRADKSKFSWLLTSPARNDPAYNPGSWDWLYSRQEAAQKQDDFDPSDAGMIIYLLTGIENTNPSDARNLMENPVGGGGGCTGFSSISDLSATASGCNTVNLSWSDVNCEIEYIVRRKISGAATFTSLGTVASNSTSFTDNGAAASTTYVYQVRPNDGTTKLSSNQPQVTTPPCGGGGPSDINDLAASSVACDAVTLTWSDVNGETAYRVRRKLASAATFTTLTDVGANVTTYTDNSVAENTSYTYQVRPVVSGTAVATSNQPQVDTPPCGSSGGGKLFIDHNSSGQRLKANGSGGAVGTRAATATGANVQWDQVDAGGGYFYLIHVSSGNKLNATTNGDVINTVSATSTANSAQWRWIDAGGGWYRLENRQFTEWLHVNPDGVTNFQLGPITWTGDNTRWKFTNVSGVASSRVSGERIQSLADEVEIAGSALLYPNPGSDELIIRGIAKDAEVRLFNQGGIEVMRFIGDKADIRALPTGMYFVRSNNEYFGRFIKE